MSVILIGYRGSGKSSVGRILAQRLGWQFVDADDLLVKRAGQTIKEIFEQRGEEHFRDLESAIVRELCEQKNRVIALGGGAILREKNRIAVTESGQMIVLLHSDSETLLKRIQSDPQTQSTRPSLTHLGGGIQEVRKLLAERLPLYRQVKTHEIDVSYLPPEQVAERIVQMLQPKPH